MIHSWRLSDLGAQAIVRHRVKVEDSILETPPNLPVRVHRYHRGTAISDPRTAMVVGLTVSLVVFSSVQTAGQDMVVIGGSGLPPVEINLEAALAPQLERPPVRVGRPSSGLAPGERPPLVEIGTPGPSFLVPPPRTRLREPAPVPTGNPAHEVIREIARMPRPSTRISETSLAATITPLRSGAAPSATRDYAIAAPPRAAVAKPDKEVTATTSPRAPAYAVIARLVFPAGGAELGGTLAQRLDTVADGMNTRDERLLLQAYAAAGRWGASDSRRLSLARALAVRSYLIRKGLESARIDVRALGTAGGGGSPDRVDIILLAR